MNINKSPSFKAVIVEPSFERYMHKSDVPKLSKLFKFMRENKKNDFFIDAFPDRSLCVSIMKTNPLMAYLDRDLFTLSKDGEKLVYAMQRVEDVYKSTHGIEDPLYEGYIHPDRFTPADMVKLIKVAVADFNKNFNINRFLN